MGRVFVISPVAKDIEGVRKFGKITYIFQRQIHMAEKKSIDSIVNTLYKKLKDFDSANDYFLTVGSNVLNCMAVAVLCDSVELPFRMLTWDSKSKKYLEVSFDLLATEDDDNEEKSVETSA